MQSSEQSAEAKLDSPVRAEDVVRATHNNTLYWDEALSSDRACVHDTRKSARRIDSGEIESLDTDRALRQIFAVVAPVSALCLVAVSIWWIVDRSEFPLRAYVPQSGTGQTRDIDVQALAIVNPANRSMAQAQISQQSVTDTQSTDSRASSLARPQLVAQQNQSQENLLQGIAVVTPTSDLEVSDPGAIDLLAIDVEQPNAPATSAPAELVTGTGFSVEDLKLDEAQVSKAASRQHTDAPNSELARSALSKILLPFADAAAEPTPIQILVEIPGASAQTGAQVLPAAHSRRVVQRGIQPEIVLVPTATPMPTPTPTQTPYPIQTGEVPMVDIVPALGVRFTPTPELPTPTPLPTVPPTPEPPAFGPGRLWASFTPGSPQVSDHFWIGSPFANLTVNHSASPSYQFGSTAGDRYRPHHGLDISNPLRTPILAAVEGEVIHAGQDDPALLGPYNNFYGNAVVIRLDQRLPVAGGQLDVYLLYGHMSEVQVAVGQRVKPDDVVGLVGMTGIAIGPHLHVEIRLGANTYSHSVNPYLWLKPAPGNGAVAVRLLTADGRTWAGAKLSIARFEGGRSVWGRQIETYLDTENIGPDPAWGENGAMGDAPAGYYLLVGRVNGENVRVEFFVEPGETTFVEIRTEQ